MRPPPRGMVIETVAVLDAVVPVLFEPVALTAGPLTGLTLTVICVFRGRFEQCTTMGIGLLCCAESMASGVERTPLGEAETGTPPTLVTVNCGNWPAVGIMMGWKPELNWPLILPLNSLS